MPYVEHCPVLVLCSREWEKLKKGQWRATKRIRGLENLAREERFKELGFFSLEERRLR